jgi:hypothetical protein
MKMMGEEPKFLTLGQVSLSVLRFYRVSRISPVL